MINPEVNEYFKKQPEDRRKILKQLRSLILETLPGAEESFLYGVPVYDRGRIYLVNLKNQINLGFSIIGLSKQAVDLFEGSGKTARHIKIFSPLKKNQKEDIKKIIRLVSKKAGIPK
ncbi:MAG: DUF1801 domain-containing protein [Patescibacteria group bacterium]